MQNIWFVRYVSVTMLLMFSPWPAQLIGLSKWNNFFVCYLSFVIDVYQNSESYACQSISQEKNHNVLPLFYGTEKKDVQKLF